jgi:hypothetical protein
MAARVGDNPKVGAGAGKIRIEAQREVKCRAGFGGIAQLERLQPPAVVREGAREIRWVGLAGDFRDQPQHRDEMIRLLRVVGRGNHMMGRQEQVADAKPRQQAAEPVGVGAPEREAAGKGDRDGDRHRPAEVVGDAQVHEQRRHNDHANDPAGATAKGDDEPGDSDPAEA